MAQVDLSGVVSGVSGYATPPNPYEGSLANPISGWNTPPEIQQWPNKTRFQFISENGRSHIRYDNDKEGRHLHYDNLVENSSGFVLKVWIGNELSYAEFQKKAPKLKRLGNGYVKDVRKLLQSDEKHSVELSSGFSVTVNVRIMRFCPSCNSEISAEFQECPYCGKEFK